MGFFLPPFLFEFLISISTAKGDGLHHSRLDLDAENKSFRKASVLWLVGWIGLGDETDK